jgi:heptose-I-phosphate ethanolaminephosphotransferase
LTSLLVISNTNWQESLDFFDLKANVQLLVLIPYTLLFFFSFKIKKVKSYKSFSSNIFFIILFSILFIAENSIHNRLIRKGVPRFIKTSISFFDKMKLYQEAKQENYPKELKVKSSVPTQKQTFVLILGESCNRNHMSLYGYHRKTTPKLDSRKDIITYDNIVSPYSNTLNSVLTILSNSCLDHKVKINQRIDLLDILHSAAYKNYWLSNQSPIGIWDNQVTVFANKADQTTFVNLSSNTSFGTSLHRSYDSKLFKPLQKALKEKQKNKFILLHLLGNHSRYLKRYPPEYSIWQGKTKEEKIISEYDNSILFNDFVVDSLLNIIKHQAANHPETIYIAIYLSDHGENVYDEGKKVGHDYVKVLPKANVEIPFLVWLSKSYISQRPKKTKLIKSRLNIPFVTDNLFHSIMDILTIETKFFDSTKSIFHPDYNLLRKRILEDGQEYDKK